MTTTPFICPRCGAVSHNPHDAEQRYCGRCHVFVDDPAGSDTKSDTNLISPVQKTGTND